ncbi:MAG: ATP-binding cassette domain-containing protein [Bacillus subtilis]|nr:ATP-binding cassette domain-containing protein [Bacillus subtilis]
MKPDVRDREGAIELQGFRGKIEFRNVWFAYIGEDWILKDVSFVVEPKETIAFVGATGSGKTTILSLIVRNYEIQQGQILIDDIDIRDLKMASLRKYIGQMMQDVFLFSGTVESNIRLRDDSISDQEIVEACKYVNADRFIDKMPNKYNELVRERGNNFSTGQRQLLSFARTLVHRPSVMILDEATANIDTETEELIQESLKKLMHIGTMIIVAHRLSTIQHVDKIIVMQKGKIIEMGSHQELLHNKGHYYTLYRLQYDKRTQYQLIRFFERTFRRPLMFFLTISEIKESYKILAFVWISLVRSDIIEVDNERKRWKYGFFQQIVW